MTTDTQPARRQYRNVLQAFTEKPWAILPSKLALLSEIIALHMKGVRFTDEELEERSSEAHYHGAYLAARGGGGRHSQTPAVAVIPIYGVIMPRADAFMKMSGGTGMDQFMAALNQAANDTNVSAILLDVDSPGGQVDLVPEAAAAIRSARSKKQVVAVSNTMAASAAYWLASQASELVVTPSGEVGSVGVFAGHNDLSQAMAAAGVKQTLIHAGKYKVELASNSPLSEEAQAYVQQGVDDFYSMFTRDISAGRKVSVADVRGPAFGEGRMVLATRAVAQGMADRVDTFDNTLARLLNGGGVKQGAQAGVEEAVEFAAYMTPAQARQMEGLGTDTSAAFIGGHEFAGLFAGPIPYKETEVVDEPWDGPAEEAKLPNDGGAEVLRPMYAWEDSDGDSATKEAYKFPHHQVVDGKAGPANVNGVRAGLSRLDQADIPEADRAGVKSHLQRHLDDFHAADGEAGEGQASVDSPQESLAGLRQNSRTARISERESYLGLLRRMNK